MPPAAVWVIVYVVLGSTTTGPATSAAWVWRPVSVPAVVPVLPEETPPPVIVVVNWSSSSWRPEGRSTRTEATLGLEQDAMSERLTEALWVSICAPLDGLTRSTLPVPVPITRTPLPSKAIEAY